MKKFAKILGFLGFFVTLATAQIGTAWAVLCNPGQYLPAGSDQCAECPGTKSIDGTNQGVYCPYAQNYKEKAPEDQGLSPCRPVCGTNNYWLTTRESAAEADACTGTCSGSCIIPADCLEANGCFPIIETVSGTLSCGDTECHISEECKTKTCDDYCYVPSSDGETCVPKTNKAPQYRCSLDEQAVYFGIDATYGQPYTVTGSANLCVAPSNNQEFAGWILTNDDYSGPYMPGTSSGTIASWPCVNDPVIFIPSWTGICLEVIFDENGGTSPSGGHNKLYKIDGETGNKWYEAGCEKQVDNPQVEGKPTKNNATFVGYYGPSPSEIYVFEPYSTGDYSTLVSNNNWVATSNRHTLYAHFICNTGYHPVNGVCVENSYDITYICNNGTNQYTATDTINFNDSYKVNGLVGNPILPVGNDANVQCTPPAGNVFTGWWFNLSLQGYDNHAPIERWTWDNDGTFTATWGKGEFEITLDPTTGAWNSNVPDEQRKLYTIYSDGVYITSAREPGDQMTSTENPLNRIPEKTATVTFKYCDGDSCNNPTHPDTEQDVEIAFKGFYQGVNSGPQYISLDQNAQRWYITPQGDWDGKYYTSSKTWYAQWANGSVTLPTIPSDFWPGHTFLGWFTEETGGTEITSPYAVTDSITLYAHWDVSCFRVSFDDETNNGQSTGDGNPDLYKSLNDTNWYNNDTCSGDPMPLTDVVARYLPVSLDPHAHFAQYNTGSNGTGWEIFNAAGKLTDGTNGGTSESNGTIWEINQNTALFAIYDCDEYYEPGDNGTCVGKSYDVTYVCNNDEGETAVHEDGATYGNAYRVNRYGVNSTTKIIECEIPNGHTFDDWLLNCGDELYDDGVEIERWTCTNNPTFTAKWAKKNFEITLNPNGGSWNDATQEQQTLYTTFDTAVYRDSLRQEVMTWNNNELKPIPTKTINISIYANSPDQSGATFEWNGTTVSQVVNDPQNLGLSGFYETTSSGTPLISYNNDKAGWYITDTPDIGGIAVGIGYDGTNASYAWYAHWGTYDLPLPSTATWNGHDFAGWKCVDDEDNTIYTWTPGNNSTPAVTGISENITCTAQWVVACRTVTFNENGGTPNAQYGTYDTRSKVVGDTTWYTNSTCGGGILVPDVSENIPTRGEHEHFVGYNTASNGSGDEIFDEDGALVNYNWTITQNATLYAQYECDEPYHNHPQTGACVACPQGTFYNPDSTTSSDFCDSCDAYIKAKAREWNMEWALDYTWSSNRPYTWSVDQCYRECRGEGSNEVDTCDIFQLTSTDMNNRMEQFLPDELINGNTGKQISFFGNERTNIKTCNPGTGTRYCPVGLLSNASILSMKPIAAPVDFHIDPINSPNETKSVYIVGGRVPSIVAQGLKLQNGFAWTQVSGPGQNSPDVNHIVDGQNVTFNYIHIIYPAEAPNATETTGQTFTGYGYPQNHPQVITNGRDLTTTDATSIVSYANSNAYNDMSPIVGTGYTRNLYAQYTANPTYTLTYSCGDGGGTPPAQQTGIYAGNTVNISVPSNCSHYSTHSLTEWAVTATESEQNFEPVPASTTSFTWNYDQDVTFTAVWGNASTHRIIYNKIPETGGNNITSNGNTLVRPNADTMPTQFECDNENTNITGQPQLKNSDGDVIGEVKQWCDNNDLSSECSLPKTISHTPCTDKNVYAKWECTDPRYHLNETKDDCVACSAGEYWDENEGCQSCSLIGPGWTSKPGYNQSINQCYRICNGSNETADVSCESPDVLLYPGFNMRPIVEDENHQIEFYGNWRYRGTNPELDVCGENTAHVTYCARIIRPLFTTHDADRLMSSKVTFKNNNNEDAGTRHLVGYTPAFVEDISNISFVNGNKIWSHIMGPGQYATGYDHRDYVYTIYPTNIAPNPGDTGAQFMGYYDAQTGGVQRVAAALGLNSNNAIAFAQTPLSENQIGDRTLYPQYCPSGQEWDPSANNGAGACIAQAQVYDVKYVCGEHGTPAIESEMTNTATSGQPYMVAALEGDLTAACTANTDYVLKTNNDNKPIWKFNDNNNTEYFTGEVINQWNFTIQSPTFTAQYDCARGYTWNQEHTACVSISDEACPAELSENSHATMIGEPTINDDGKCVYTIKCDLCQTSGSYGCYTHDPISNGQFTQLGNQYDADALEGVSCTPAKFKVALNPNGGNTGLTPLWETYGEGWSKTENGEPQGSLTLSPTDLPTWAAHVFTGYNGNQAGTGSTMIIPNGDISAQPTILEDNNQTWYAQWADAASVTVTFKCDDDDSQVYNYTGIPAFEFEVPGTSACSKTGYTFTQWEENPATNSLEPIPANFGQYNWTYDFGATFVPNWTENEYDVKYVCNGEAVATNRATYDQTYTVLNHNNLTGCTAPDGKVFVGWGFSNNGTTPYLEDYDDGEEFTWQYTVQQPTFTAIWDDGCYAITFNNTRFGQWNSVSAPSKFYKKGQDWYADTSRRCDGSEINPLISVLPQKDNATFIGYDTDGESADASSDLVFNNIGSLTDYGQTWPTTDDTKLYAKYDCDDGYTLNGTTCVLDSSNFHTITLDKNVGTLHGDNSDPDTLYTIYGSTTVYKNAERTDEFSRLDENPEKYAEVTFHFCDGTGNSCANPSNANVTKKANFTFGGFYIQHPDESDRYISSDGWITPLGGQMASTYPDDRTWYAVWGEHGMVTSWPDDPTNPDSAYGFGGWYTQQGCGGTRMYAGDNYDADTNLYACWSQNLFTVTYNCGQGHPTGNYQDTTQHPTPNGTYTVLANGAVPDGNDGVITCVRDGWGFNGWKFSGEPNNDPYFGGDIIRPWTYGDGTTMTAQYRQCTTEEVLVNGVCYPKCEDKTCTIPNSQYDNECPDHDPQYPNDGSMHCTYSDPAIVQGYYIDNEHTTCLYANGANQGSPINEGYCPETPVCNPGYTWSTNPWGCIPDPNATYTIQFICEQNGTPITTPQTVHYGDSITVPSNSVCTNNPGYSYSQWEATQYSNPATLEAQNSTYQYTWEQTHDETFIADWNDGNVYHVNLHAYSCDDPTNPDLTGTFNSYTGVQELWEKYNVAWYKNAGLDDQITTLSSLQLPTLSGWMFGGYNKTDGMPRLSCDNGTCENLSPTLIRDNEDWCAVWSKCNANEYWNNGDCISCSTATGGQYPYAAMGATSINDCYNRPCYRDCQPNFSACNIPHAETYTYVNESFIGSMYFSNTNSSACQLDIWLPETSGTVPNCQCRVATCETGYHPNNDNTACLPNNYMITLNSHIDGFNGHASSPEVLYTKYGPNGGAYLDSAYAYLMNDERSLYAVPVKSADVILNGNGGNVIWNGYSSSTATLTATFGFQGFYPSVYGGNQYISDTGYITPNGNSAAQQNQGDSTVWHAQWQDGSITLPDAQRQCYTFNGWWTDVYNGGSAGNANMPYTPTGATTNLYAHWTPGTYSITYHNGNAIYNGCTQTSYTFGNMITINCSITPQAGSHKVFNGWRTNPELTAGCTQNPVISNTDCGDKDYYACWECESGYNLENGVCVPNASELCPATTLPSNSHATLVNGVPNDGGTQCIYTLKCDACIGCNSSLYTCYTNGNSANNNGIFTVIGNIGDASALNNVRCNATQYDVRYRCNSNTAGTVSSIKATYGQSYTVEYNNTTVHCTDPELSFSGWNFNGEPSGNPSYVGGDQITWNYCNLSQPTFTAYYSQCSEGWVYVPCLGECRPKCDKSCTWPGAGTDTNPTQCPNGYPTGTLCYYNTNVNQAHGYIPEGNSGACYSTSSCRDLSPNQCPLDGNPICPDPDHYHWNQAYLRCDPNIYTVTLDPCDGVAGSVTKLKEKWAVGWSKDNGNSFQQPLDLNSSERPSWPNDDKVFDGYWTTCDGGSRMVEASGRVSAAPTTIENDYRTWYARYVDNPGPFTVTFRCDQDDAILNTQNPYFGDYIDVLAAPYSGCTNHPGETFNQWRIVANGALIPSLYNGFPGSYRWMLHEGSQIVPDWRPVYEVTLKKGATDAVPGSVTKLWNASGIGWFGNSDLTQPVSSPLTGSQLPTRQGYSFAGYFIEGTTPPPYRVEQNGNLPGNNVLTSNEVWVADWSQCEQGQYYDVETNSCLPCGSPYTDNPHAIGHEQCYYNCSEDCAWNDSIMTNCNIPHATQYAPVAATYSGQHFWGYNYCSLNYWSSPHPAQAIPACQCRVTECEAGWSVDSISNSCKENDHWSITLNPHLVNNTQGSYSSPRVLYTWHGKGVYLYEDYSQYLMNGNQNPLVSNPQTYATVTFNLNGDGAWLDWENQRYTDPVDIDVPLTYLGFYKSETDSDMVINTNRYIEPAGTQAGKTATANLEWHAHWQPRQIGTVTGSQLPQPSRPGFNFVGWFNTSASNGGTQIYATTAAAQNMPVYARWTKETYTITLNANNCQASATTLSKLYEQYDAGWSRSQNDTFTRDLILYPSELPTPANSDQVFIGYYTSRNTGGDMMISANGTVIADPIYTSDQTWYARCVTNNGPFTVQFKCSANDAPIPGYDHTNVQYDDYINVPTVAQSGCSQDGATFTKWKASNHNIQINANVGSYQWSHHYGEVFTPDWNSEIYYVTLDQNGASTPGVLGLYEKYGLWWSLNQNGNPQITFLSGSDLPSRTGFNFGGYADENDRPVGSYNPTNNKWNLPDNTTVSSNGIIWTAIWTPCTGGQYWDGNKCYQCPTGFTDNPSAVDNEDYCYGNCRYNCRDVCPLANQLPEGMESCTPNTEGYPQPGRIYYGTQLQGCLPEGTYGNQPGLPNCESIITCKPGYHLVNGVCVEYVKTDIMLNPNGGTWSSNVPSEYRYLYTIESTGVYRDSDRTEEMTPNNNMSLHAIPSNGASITLNANGGIVTWGGGTGEILNRNAAFEFLGFYDSQTPGFAAQYILPREINGETYAFITTGGQSAGMGYTTTPHTWYAQWNRSVTLPTPERQNYTFVGWTYNGELISNPWTVPGNTTNVTLIAQWTKNDGTIVAYKCDDGDGGIGGTGYDTLHPAYFGENYNVLPNGIVNGGVVNCSKPANITLGRRYHEFEDWVFSGDYAHYDPGEINWTFNVDNPTFNAHYKECSDGSYFDGSCKTCPYGYNRSDIDATIPQNCYRDCSEQCIESCPQLGEPGVIGCIYPTPRPTTEGQEYYGSTCNAVAENCAVIGVYCQNGYVPTSDGLHCQKDEDNYYEITLDPNGGTVGQEKLYTIHNIGVYLDSDRTRPMSAHNNYLTNLPQKSAVATFDCNPECSAPVSPVSVELVFNGYYERQSGGAKYINKFMDNGVAKGAITSDGNREGKGYTANATWFAQWSWATIGNSRWPTNPTRPNACVTYSFDGWWTAANGGTVVSPDTPVSENVTWYAHWCESCPTGTIDHGSCAPQNCKATFTCDDGYTWDETQCQCVAATGLTLTYDLAGGTLNPDYYLDGGTVSLDGQQITYNMMYDQSFSTLDGTVATKNKSVLCSWRGPFPELAHQYTYNINENTTLRANWVQCQCEPWGDGVASCDTHVENNLCRPDFTCNPGYVPVQLGACSDDCNATCHVSCTKCPAGTYQNGGQCSPCAGNTVSAAGATVCEQCATGYTANAEHTQCVGNPITIDWDENGGQSVNNGSCQFCTNGCDGITCESCDAHPDNMLTLANVTHSNSAMQFLGWKLFTGDSTYPAGTKVMCTYDNVGVYSGTSREIKAQWNECQCSDQLNPHVVCQPVIVDDVCRHVYWCDSVGYNLVGDDYSNTSPYCDPKTFDVTYNCGVGATGTPLISADTATYDDTYIVKNAGGVNCQKVGFNFVGWLFDGDNYLHQADDRITWTYTSNKTFTAQYSQCGLGEIWNNGVCICDEDNGYYLINGTCQQCQGYTVWNGTECAPCNAGEIWENGVCKPCTCNEGTGVVAGSCDTQSTSTNTCAGTAECKDGYINPTVVCDGTVCNATCSACELGMIEVDGVCLPCECTNGEGVNSCNATSNNNQCVASGGCKTGYSDFDWTCNGTHCSSQCTPDIYRFVLNQNGGLTGSNFVGQIWEQYGHGWSKNMEGPFTLEGLKADELPSPVDQSTVFGGYYYGTDLMITETGILLPSPNIAEDQTWTAKWNNNNGPFTVRFKCTTNADPFVTYNNVNFDGYINVPNTSECEANGIACTQWKIERNGETIPTEYNGGLYQWNRRYDADIVAICSANTYEITLDDMIGNNATGTNGQGMLYTIFGAGVYRDAARTKQMTETQYPLTVIPTKSADVTLKYCDGDNSSCTNPTTNDVVTSLVLSFTGYYESPFSGKKYIEQNTDNGYWYISAYGNTAGTNTADDQTWYAHWNAATMNTLPTPTRDGYEFGGWWNAATSGVQVSAPFAVEENMTLYAHWTPCADGYISTAATGYVCTPCACNEGAGVVSGSCSTQSTDANTCAGTAECQNGYISPNVTCDGPTCTATCTLGGSNAVYKCGTGIGAGYSTYVNYGDPHTILTNAFVGCYRDNSTFAGWAFNGDNTIYFDNVGATVTWNYTDPKEFEAKWCDNCSVVEHGTNQLTIPEPGLCSCVLTCDTGYHVNSSTHTCEPNVYPNENGITYKPNGGTPNRNYTQSVIYDAPFTTLGAVYSKARHILNSWDVESGGAGTFNGTAALNTTYTYHTDGATSLLAEWIECGINEISLDNRCQQCRCTDNNAGVTSCETSATNDDTCSCSGECAAGYINAGCNCNGTNCTQSCKKCEDNQVSVNNVCEDCECKKNIDGIEGIISGCGFVSNNGNTCNWNPTTCRLGYGYPDLTCTESEHNNNCTASCTICPTGTYGDNGIECKPCPDGYTSLAGATSIRECFIDPNSCGPDEHIEHGECVSNTRACSIPNATSAARIWNPAIGTYGPCTVVECDTANGYHESGNACVRDTCVVAHGSAESEYNGGQWECFVTKCDPGYEPSSDYKSCVECANRYVDGDVAVSSYVSECEIAACMYQGQKYTLEGNECVPICTADRFTREDPSNPTGTIQWDERTKKCIRTCNPGYKMW